MLLLRPPLLLSTAVHAYKLQAYTTPAYCPPNVCLLFLLSVQKIIVRPGWEQRDEQVGWVKGGWRLLTHYWDRKRRQEEYLKDLKYALSAIGSTGLDIVMDR